MRLNKSLKNAIYSFVPFFIISALSFARISFIRDSFGDDYYGITATIMSIYTIIFTAEGGFLGLSIYSLYRPFEEKNYLHINKIFNGTQRTFRVIGLIIVILMIIGSLLVPILPKDAANIIIIDGVTQTIGYLQMVAISMIIGIPMVLDYFLHTPYTALNIANQETYLSSRIVNTSKIVRVLIEIVLMVLIPSPFGYLLAVIPLVLIHNIIIIAVIKKAYAKCFGLTKEADYSAVYDIKEYITFKIASNVNLSVDMLMISRFLGNAESSVYAAYRAVYHTLAQFAYSILSAANSSFGNLFVQDGDMAYKKKRYKQFMLVALVFGAFLAICFALFIEAFMAFWIGETALDKVLMSVVTMLVVINTIKIPINSMVFTNKLFKETAKYVMLATIINILLTFVFINFFGISGAILATIFVYIFVTMTLQEYHVIKLVFKDIKFYIELIIIKLAFLVIVFTLTTVMIYSLDGVSLLSYLPSSNVLSYLIFITLGIFISPLIFVLVNYIFTLLFSDYRELYLALKTIIKNKVKGLVK